jgi:uncharacterized protein YdhG (YjbR/CyaY superfamily)
MSYVKDPRVDAYLDPLPAWQRKILERVRDLVHEADADVEETIKRTVQPYFVLDGNVCAFLAAKDHVNVFLYDPIAVSSVLAFTGLLVDQTLQQQYGIHIIWYVWFFAFLVIVTGFTLFGISLSVKMKGW